MVVKIITNTPFKADFLDIIRAFSPDICEDEDGTTAEIILENQKVSINFAGETIIEDCKSNQANLIKRQCKILLYNVLSKTISRELPYGSLTGIRPTKLYHELIEQGMDADDYFKNTLKVSENCTEFVSSIVKNQENYYTKKLNEVDLFINIPICVSRCSYCSFVSAIIGQIKHWLEPYTQQLVREIIHAKKIIEENNYKVRSIYIGGGTPTSLSEQNFAKILAPLADIACREFTVEAGRVDTINQNKLDIMKKANVSRISINPQTFNDKTLIDVGRGHTSAEVYRIYELAKQYKFLVNMDLIAMLPGESLQDFKYSLEECISLNPDNITIHTLAIKRGSKLAIENYDNQKVKLAEDMIDFSKKTLLKAGYKPYYMYKQKYMSGALENTGYEKGDSPCIYNIDIMEETQSIIACGAGGISKRIFDGNRLERVANPKGIDVYLEREDKILMEKEHFFKI